MTISTPPLWEKYPREFSVLKDYLATRYQQGTLDVKKLDRNKLELLVPLLKQVDLTARAFAFGTASRPETLPQNFLEAEKALVAAIGEQFPQIMQRQVVKKSDVFDSDDPLKQNYETIDINDMDTLYKLRERARKIGENAAEANRGGGIV